MQFTKMHGLGNDYVYVNCFEQDIADAVSTAKLVSSRHFGIGSDGLILICPSDVADVRMRMYNADGSESEMCGNGIRCVAKFSYEHKLGGTDAPFTVPGGRSFAKTLTVETGRGVLTLGLEVDSNDKVQNVCVNMGEPILSPAKIPVNLDFEPVVEAAIDVQNQRMLMTCVSMGNPHAIFFTDDLASVELSKLGSVIECHELFPNRINVHFVQVLSDSQFNMSTWERGSGETLACGTGACACCVAAVLTNRCSRSVKANLPGGSLFLNWSPEDNNVYMTGTATEVFTGNWPD